MGLPARKRCLAREVFLLVVSPVEELSLNNQKRPVAEGMKTNLLLDSHYLKMTCKGLHQSFIASCPVPGLIKTVSWKKWTLAQLPSDLMGRGRLHA